MSIRNSIVILLFVSILAVGDALAEGDVARGQQLAGDCADCHGENGLGDGDEFPAIAGMEEVNMRKALMDFKSGERVDEYEMMVDTASDLSEQDIADLAAYFATLR